MIAVVDNPIAHCFYLAFSQQCDGICGGEDDLFSRDPWLDIRVAVSEIINVMAYVEERMISFLGIHG